MAETVPTTRMPRSRASTSRRATCRIFSGSATDEPPNFMTTVSGVGLGGRVHRRDCGWLVGLSLPRAAQGRCLIGLDCAEPSLVLERWRDELPTLSGLMERGSYGRLTSVIPPITVPAWSCMMSSKTPGDLGVYGFRNRSDHTYEGGFIAMSDAIREPRLWDLVTRAGGSSVVLSVPGTYPPRPLNGVMVSCFLTPSIESKYTYPAGLRDEIEDVVGEYIFDTKDFRTDDKDYLLRQVYEMTDRRFQLAEHLAETKPWTFFAMVEMGPDRMHHGFWKFMDPEHRKHEPGNEYENAILDYHRHVDGLIARPARARRRGHGRLRPLGPRREAARRRDQDQRVAAPRGPAGHAHRAGRRSSLRDVGIDWPKTTAWGEGGYYARVFLNVQGREPEGVIPPSSTRPSARDLARRIAEIPDDAGNPIPTAVYTPEELYDEPARASRRTSSSSSATSTGARSGRSAATRESRHSRTTRGRTTRTTPRTACTSSPGPESTRVDGRRAPARHRSDRARDPRDRGAGGPARAEHASPSRGSLICEGDVSTCLRVGAVDAGRAAALSRWRSSSRKAGLKKP